MIPLESWFSVVQIRVKKTLVFIVWILYYYISFSISIYYISCEIQFSSCALEWMQSESKVESQEDEEEKIKVERYRGWRQCGVLVNNDAGLYFTGRVSKHARTEKQITEEKICGGGGGNVGAAMLGDIVDWYHVANFLKEQKPQWLQFQTARLHFSEARAENFNRKLNTGM